MQIPAAGRTGLYRNDWLVACTGRMYTGRTGLYWKDVHWKDRLVLEGCTLEGPACTGRMYTGRTGLYWKDVHWKDRLVLEGCTLEGSACTGRISLYWKDWLGRKDLLVLKGSACTERISLYWKDWLVQKGSACVSLYCDLPGLCTTLRWFWLFTGLCITLLWPFWFLYHSQMTYVVHQLVFHSPVNFLVCVSLWDDLCGPLACISCLLCLCIIGSSPGHVTSVHQAEGVLTWTVQHTHWWVRSEQLECDASVYSPVDTDACQWIPSSHCSAWACELCSAWLDYLPSPVGWNSVSSLFLAQSQSSIQKELNQMFRYVAVFFHLW